MTTSNARAGLFTLVFATMSPSFSNIRRINFRRIIGGLAAVSALLLLQACSAIKLGYNNGTELAYFWLDGYVDFRDDQSPQVREELGKLLAWHRTEELPKLAELLQKVQRLAAADVTPGQICTVYADARERFDATTRRADPAAVWLVMSLSADQLKHIDRQLKKADDKFRKDTQDLTPAERMDRRVKSNVERAEEFYGRLDDKQVAQLRGAMEAATTKPELNQAERQRRQADFAQTLRVASGQATPTGANKPGPPEVLSLLRGYQERMAKPPSADYRAYSDKLTQESCETFAGLHNSTSKEQRDRAVRRLAAYERDARELHAQR